MTRPLDPALPCWLFVRAGFPVPPTEFTSCPYWVYGIPETEAEVVERAERVAARREKEREARS